MSVMASQITGISVACSTVSVQIKENIKAPSHWPLWGEYTGDAENVSIWWRHHDANRYLIPTQMVFFAKSMADFQEEKMGKI